MLPKGGGGVKLPIAQPKTVLGQAAVESPPEMQLLVLTGEKNAPFTKSLPWFLVQRSGQNGRQQRRRRSAPGITKSILFNSDKEYLCCTVVLNYALRDIGALIGAARGRYGGRYTTIKPRG